MWLVLTPQDPMGQWELDLGVMELLDRWPAALAGCNLFHLHDLDRVGPGTVSGTHVSVCREGGRANVYPNVWAFLKPPIDCWPRSTPT